jgi:hypothetical protein
MYRIPLLNRSVKVDRCIAPPLADHITHKINNFVAIHIF